jgi:hypothetical protein
MKIKHQLMNMHTKILARNRELKRIEDKDREKAWRVTMTT